MKQYDKPRKTFPEQVELLSSRGLAIKEPAQAELLLRRVNYYRLRAYTLPFEHPPHTFLPGTKLEDIIRLYEFDAKLRNIVFSAIGNIEISLRTAVAYSLAHKYGTFAHEDLNNFKRQFYGHAQGQNKWHGWIEKVHRQAREKEKSEIFIGHFKLNYQEYPALPVWVMVETISMALLSQLYSGMLRADQIPVAREYGIHSEVFSRWLHNFTYIRNICAHHSSLWNRTLSVELVLPANNPAWRGLSGVKFGSVMYAISAVLGAKVFTDEIRAEWRTSIESLFSALPPVPRFWERMGLPENWKEHPLWKKS